MKHRRPQPHARASRTTARGAGAVVAASLALPGVFHAAHAESAPESGIVGIKFLHYQD